MGLMLPYKFASRLLLAQRLCMFENRIWLSQCCKYPKLGH